MTVPAKLARSLCAAVALFLAASPGAAHSQALTTASSSVAVSAAVRGVHLVVLDDAGEISEIWSNSSDADTDVIFRSATRNGPELPATPELVQRYQATASSIEWTRGRGLVWQREP